MVTQVIIISVFKICLIPGMAMNGFEGKMNVYICQTISARIGPAGANPIYTGSCSADELIFFLNVIIEGEPARPAMQG